MSNSIRARSTQFLASVAIGAALVTLTPMLGAWPQTTAQAQYVVAAEFREALSPYGRWQHHSRWGEVWSVDHVASDWRPYTRGRWIYTDDWGWYWDVGSEEADWGWVTYHYGRWVYDGELGWIWVPGEDWGPAWVDWRYGDDYVGWAPLPPDELLVSYRDDPVYWSFVRPRYLLAPRVFLVFAPPRDRIVIIRRTKIVNRTVIVDRDRRDRDGRDRDGRRGRVAVNPGIEPGIIARATGKPIRASKVEPAVLRGTKVDGAREVDPSQGKRTRASVKQSDTVIRPTRKVEPPKELGANEKGRLGNRPPKAAQNAAGSDTGRRSGDNQSGDQGRSQSPSPPVNAIRGGTNDSGRSVTPPSGAREPGNQQGQRLQSPPSSPSPPVNVIRGGNSDSGRSVTPPSAAREPGNQQGQRLQSPPPPPPPVNVIRGGSSDIGRSAPPRLESPSSGDRGNQQGQRLQSPPSPPPAVHRSPPPPPPPVVRRPPPPPPAVTRAPPPPVVNRQPPEQRGNRPNNRQQDERVR
jgi:hypothetical protein